MEGNFTNFYSLEWRLVDCSSEYIFVNLYFLRGRVFVNLKVSFFLEMLLHFSWHYLSYLSETRCKVTFFVSAIVLKKRKCFQSDIGVMIAMWTNCALYTVWTR